MKALRIWSVAIAGVVMAIFAALTYFKDAPPTPTSPATQTKSADDNVTVQSGGVSTGMQVGTQSTTGSNSGIVNQGDGGTIVIGPKGN